MHGVCVSVCVCGTQWRYEKIDTNNATYDKPRTTQKADCIKFVLIKWNPNSDSGHYILLSLSLGLHDLW